MFGDAARPLVGDGARQEFERVAFNARQPLLLLGCWKAVDRVQGCFDGEAGALLAAHVLRAAVTIGDGGREGGAVEGRQPPVRILIRRVVTGVHASPDRRHDAAPLEDRGLTK